MKPFVQEWGKSFILFTTKALVVFLLVILVVVLSGTYLNNAVEDAYYYEEERTLSIEGTAEIDVVPDTVVVSFGVTLKGKDPVALQNEGNTKINATITALEEQGIKKEEIKTTSYQLSTPYYYYNESEKENELSFELSMAVTLKNVEQGDNRPGEVIKIATEQGLNRIYGINYYIEDRETVERELRLQAIADAKDQKEELEDATEIKLGDIVNVYLGSSYGIPYYRDEYSYAMAEDAAAPASVPAEIQIGSQKMTATVTVYYEIR